MNVIKKVYSNNQGIIKKIFFKYFYGKYIAIYTYILYYKKR